VLLSSRWALLRQDDGGRSTPWAYGAAMHINSVRLRELRSARQWSQEQLAQLSGLNLRTIQRLESGAKVSTESLRALSAVFEVPAESLLMGEPGPSQPALAAIREGVLRGLQFSGVTARAEFWWFALAVAMVLALAQLLAQSFGLLPLQIASLIVLLPWIAACSRRLRDAGLNPWWQLISLAPVGGILVLLYLLSLPTRSEAPVEATAG
jgi:transcriptional regulator with XRE-family HTH domain